ncbi:UDP-xylose transporter 3 [Glycine soja]
MGEGERFQLGTVGALTLSVVSSVSIVICNKALMSSLHFIFATTLTSWHLLVTFCSLHVALKMRFFEHKPFEQKAVMGFGILNGISIGLLNLSLGFNSVGFYQMTKLAIIPCTVLLETIFLGKRFSKRIQFALSILLLGVGIATVTDLQLNALGSFLSFLAVITTCVAQIVFIILSCLISISVNFSTFLVIGKTSPVTYQVLGHLKTCLVLAFGYILLRDPFSWRNILGILIAMIGMILYSYYCTLENQQKTVEAASQSSQAREDESDPLMNVENGSAVVSSNVGQRQMSPVWSKSKD